MPAQGEGDVGIGSCIAEGGGDCDSEEGGVRRLGEAGGVVVHKAYWCVGKAGRWIREKGFLEGRLG